MKRANSLLKQMESGLLRELGSKMKGFVVELDLAQEKNPEKYIEGVRIKILDKGDEVMGVFKSEKMEGIYPIHCGRRANA